jgi:hypothetical protein
MAVRLDGRGAVGAERRSRGSEHNNREEEDAANRGSKLHLGRIMSRDRKAW